jgi:pSer/pThr/pTyr-binding forkhead associated (FHA) protein
MAVRLVVRPPGGKADYSLTFDQQKVSIGRGSSVDLCLPHAAVSEVHCIIRLEGADYLLTDPGSTNGTTVNGSVLVVGRPKLLRSGDTIGIAGFEIGFRAGAAMEGIHTAERTAALAKRMVREAIDAMGAGGAPPRLVLLNGPRKGERIELAVVPSVVVVGRGEGCDVVLDDADASRRHAEFRREWDGVTVKDLGAKNPTLVGEERAVERRLKDRDEVLVGSTRFAFEDPAEAWLAELQRVEADAPAEPIPETRVRPVPETPPTPEAPVGAPAAPPPPSLPSRPAPARRRASSGPSVGDWIVVLVGVAVLTGSVVAIYYVFR